MIANQLQEFFFYPFRAVKGHSCMWVCLKMMYTAYPPNEHFSKENDDAAMDLGLSYFQTPICCAEIILCFFFPFMFGFGKWC